MRGYKNIKLKWSKCGLIRGENTRLSYLIDNKREYELVKWIVQALMQLRLVWVWIKTDIYESIPGESVCNNPFYIFQIISRMLPGKIDEWILYLRSVSDKTLKKKVKKWSLFFWKFHFRKVPLCLCNTATLWFGLTIQSMAL